MAGQSPKAAANYLIIQDTLKADHGAEAKAIQAMFGGDKDLMNRFLAVAFAALATDGVTGLSAQLSEQIGGSGEGALSQTSGTQGQRVGIWIQVTPRSVDLYRLCSGSPGPRR